MPRPSAVLSAAGCLLVLVCPATRALAGPPLLPPQLVAACEKLPANAPCSVKLGGKALTGVCQQMPDHSLACMPPKHGKAAGKPKTKPPAEHAEPAEPSRTKPTDKPRAPANK